MIKLGVLLLFIVIALTAFNADHFAGFWDVGFAGITAAASMIFFSYIGLDAVSTAGDEVKDPQKTMPRAILAALIIVTTFYILVAFAALGTQPAADFESEEQAEAGLSVILENVTGSTWAEHRSGRGRGDLDLLGDPGGDVRPDPHPVRDGPRRPAAVDVRQGQPAHHDPGRQHHHRRGRHLRSSPASFRWTTCSTWCRSARWSRSSWCRSASSSCGCASPNLPRGFKVPGYPVTPVLSVLACLAGAVRPALVHLDRVRRLGRPSRWCSTCSGAGTTARSTTAATASSPRRPR